MSQINFREPTVSDASSIWNLVKSNKPLDENSRYLYVLLCHQFSNTCIVAEDNSRIVGFLSSFVSPKDFQTLFVWQAAVDESYRSRGIARDMVTTVLKKSPPDVKFVEATVTPSNKVSLKFLQNFAEDYNAMLVKKPLFSSEILGGHEQEDLVRIGPIQRQVEEVTA